MLHGVVGANHEEACKGFGEMREARRVLVHDPHVHHLREQLKMLLKTFVLKMAQAKAGIWP